jgi:hypothetical protein
MTTVLVSLIISAGVLCPHMAINKFAEHFAFYHPTDADDWVRSERSVSQDFRIAHPVNRLDFAKISESLHFGSLDSSQMLARLIGDDQKNWLVDVIVDQVFYGSYMT